MEKKKTIVQSVLSYSKSQRIGIICFFGIVIGLQWVCLFYDFGTFSALYKEKNVWLAKQNEINRLKFQQQNKKAAINPFNPNFITDFKGYKLGMSVQEIDRLLAFRKQNKFVNSPAEFQKVTKVSDSLLNAISPYFKFPDWVKYNRGYLSYASYIKKDYLKDEKQPVLIDINLATKEDLMAVYGIGDKISERILEQKSKLGAFVSMEQMQDVWGLSPEVIEKLKTSFAVKATPSLKKINVNTASVKELSTFPFFRYTLAKEIVIYRSMHGDLAVEDLSKIKGFPVDKIKIIALYLEF